MSTLRKSALQEVDGAEERMVFYNITWEGYENMLETFKRHPGVRLTYNEGTLEVVVVSFEHERIASYLRLMIEIIASEFSKDYLPAGSTTFKVRPEERGFEPDSCF
jgi:Uma2 family endonuclease